MNSSWICPILSRGFLTLTVYGVFGLSSLLGYDFEPTEGFTAGEDPSVVLVGARAGVATVTNEAAFSGNQSLKIELSAEDVELAVPVALPSEADVKFFDLAIRPVADDSVSPVYTLNVNGAVMAFVEVDGRGHLILIAPDGSSLATDVAFDIDEFKLAKKWMRVTVRTQAQAKVFDLFVDGQPVLTDGKLNPNSSGLKVYPSNVGSWLVDSVTASSDNPLFGDQDRDGIPDAFEIANGFNPNYSDRFAVTSAGGMSNIQRFLAASGLGGADGSSSISGKRIVYVDNRGGSDGFDGKLSYRAISNGPKKSLGSALEEADDATWVALLPTGLVYPISDKDLKADGKINLMPLGSVTIQTVE